MITNVRVKSYLVGMSKTGIRRRALSNEARPIHIFAGPEVAIKQLPLRIELEEGESRGLCNGT